MESSVAAGGAGDHPSAAGVKRRHPSSVPFRPPPPLAKPAETFFRLLCPVASSAGVIGKGGAVVRQIREETSARIRVDDPVPGSDDCVVFIIADTCPKAVIEPDGPEVCNEPSPAQMALVRVFERILRVERNWEGIGEDEEIKGSVVCRLLVPNGQVGCVIGKGGKIVEKIKTESGAQIRILGHEQVPACAAAGDELIHISGSFSAVKKALLAVSNCLQDHPRVEASSPAIGKPNAANFRGAGPPPPGDPYAPSPRGYIPNMHGPDYQYRGYSPGIDSPMSGHRKVFEEEVAFRMLCPNEKVGSIIGKAGVIVRGLQNETGSSIKVAEPVPDSDERIIVVSARENSEFKHSPAQDGVLRIFSRLSEMDMGSSTLSARLLVHSQQIGCLLGKGGAIISEMRRATGANIRIFLKEHVPKCAQPNDEVVQVIGNYQSVQEALLQITGRIRETIFPLPPPHPNVGMPPPYMSGAPDMPPPYMSGAPDMPPPFMSGAPDMLPPYMSGPPDMPPPRPRNDSMPSAPYPPMGFPHGPPDRHGMEHFGNMAPDRPPFHYGSEARGPHPVFDHPASPRAWAPLPVSNVTPRGIPDNGTGFGFRSGPAGSGSQTAFVPNTTVKVPQDLLQFVYGENGTNLNDIREISNAKVVIQDPEPGAAEGTVIISGNPGQIRAAQSLLHAFILSGKTSS
ncbi:poly(rC)-binding protein 2/3/4 [Dioscorea alata]|uniref:Poly(RC)-binding protein 2/3/4 n=1 Tax=Dioscorea alata TaxID=55571 RepID=A0ACB7VD63_DIOAL|nr:poly(rC)-binding protein 2/3/4 [Dioscorea alata]